MCSKLVFKSLQIKLTMENTFMFVLLTILLREGIKTSSVNYLIITMQLKCIQENPLIH